jgi:ubiquinone/menaquinone biosynthesis C-methylase UbiE
LGIYSERVFPALLEWSLGTEEAINQRKRALAPARGLTLEIGFGTGLNLPFYSNQVDELVALEPVLMLPDRVNQRLIKAELPVSLIQGDAQALPFEDACFDTIVTTWTLCSIPDLSLALSEVRRVLKPDGIYLFCEHGRSDRPFAAKLQDLFNPLQRVVGCGCNLNRSIDRSIRSAGLEVSALDRFVMPHVPRMFGEMYLGVARVPSSEF